MRFFASIFALAAAAVCCASAASAAAVRQPWVSVPLFGYPSADFDNVYKAIAAYPQITFEVIINPNNGPGNVNDTGLPDVNWQAVVKKIKSFPNTIIIGYIRTYYSNATRDPSKVNLAIEQYSGWSSKKPEMALDGIFLDNCPWQLEYLPTWRDFAAKIRAQTGWRKDGAWVNAPNYQPGFVYFNAGSPVSPEYYQYPDRIMTEEAPYQDASLEWAIRAPNAPRDKQSILLYYKKNTWDYNFARWTANAFTGMNVGAYSLYPMADDWTYNVIGDAYPKAVELMWNAFNWFNSPNNMYIGCGQYRF